MYNWLCATVGSTGTLVSSEVERADDLDGSTTLTGANSELTASNNEETTHTHTNEDHIPMSISGR